MSSYSNGLEKATGGDEVIHPDWGASLLIAGEPTDLRESGEVTAQWNVAFHSPDSPLLDVLSQRFSLDRLSASEFLFVDIETTGLDFTPLFLIGTMSWTPKGFSIRQRFARCYEEEASILGFFADETSRYRLLVSFNGKEFDLPYIVARSRENRVKIEKRLPHLDVLQEARLHWRRFVPDCRLQTLEKHFCGRSRQGDIPGARIPEAYKEYLQTGDTREIVEVVKHNALDLLTLAELTARLP